MLGINIAMAISLLWASLFIGKRSQGFCISLVTEQRFFVFLVKEARVFVYPW